MQNLPTKNLTKKELHKRKRGLLESFELCCQRIYWAGRNLGKKQQCAGRVRRGRAESGGKSRKSDPAANSPGVGSPEADTFCHLLPFFSGQVILGGPRLVLNLQFTHLTSVRTSHPIFDWGGKGRI